MGESDNMIKTKFVVGDVVVINGKQEVVRWVEAFQTSLDDVEVNYKLSNDKRYEESELV